MNKEQIIDEAYENYRKTILTEFFENTKELRKWAAVEGPGGYNKEEFINKCITDPEFSEKWGLRIEERELSFKERNAYGINILGYEGLLDFGHTQNDDDKILYCLNRWGVPTKLIIITYNNETIESYE